MLLSLATLHDIEDIHVVVHRAYRGEAARRGWTHEADLLEGQRTDRESLRAAIASDHQTIVLARDDGFDAVVGCVHLTRQDNEVYLSMLSTEPLVQGGGIAKALLCGCEILSRSWGKEAIVISVIEQRTELVAYYERRGFVRTGATKPFPYGDLSFGEPLRADLRFVVLRKVL